MMKLDELRKEFPLTRDTRNMTFHLTCKLKQGEIASVAIFW